ncbi:endonuclease MutS2 [bacterium]|nr:endonuclease MutS2 [bacterium]
MYLLEFDEVKKLLCQYTQSCLGKNALLQATPSTKKEEIVYRQRLSVELSGLLAAHSCISGEGTPDISPILEKLHISGLMLDSESILLIGQCLKGARHIKQFIKNTNCTALLSLFEHLPIPQKLEKTIYCIYNDDGKIKDNASQNLQKIRSDIKKIRREITTALSSIIEKKRKTGCFYNEQITLREGRYVLFVKSEHRGAIEGVIHDKSLSGATSFIEPTAIIPLGNRLRSLKFDERNELIRIKRFISNLICQSRDDLQSMLQPLTLFEELLAAARFGNKYGMTYPHISDDWSLDIKDGYHPLLLSRIGNQSVPLSVALHDDCRALIVSGPNMGGKTVALKTIGLLSLMVQTGFPVPVGETSRFPVFSGIFADIGDEQSLENDMSTFSSHIVRIKYILESTPPHSLILIDEFGTGTDPSEGAALAMAVLNSFLKQNKFVVANTHLFQLKQYASNTAGVHNASLLFDEKNNLPTYHLVMDIPGSSNALHIASALGIPHTIVNEARSILGDTPDSLDTLIRTLHNERVMLNGLKKEYSEQKEAFQIISRRYKDKLKTFEQEKNAQLTTKLREMDDTIKLIKHEFENALSALNHADTKEIKKCRQRWESFHRSIAQERQEIRAEQEDAFDKQHTKPYNFKVGDTVTVTPLMLDGEITSINHQSRKAYILTENSRIEASLDNLSLLKSQKNKKEPAHSHPVHISHSNSVSINPTLDIRGLTVDDALPILEKHLSNVILSGFQTCTIIHGLGTGKLKKAVHEYLNSSQHIKNFRNGQQGEGGLGVTIVQIS